MKTVILGGCGFLGLHTAQKLKKDGVDFILIDSKQRLDRLPNFNRYYSADIDYPYKSLEAIKAVLNKGDTLIHLGWSQVPNDNINAYKKDILHNILISTELFQLATNIGVKKIIFASSGGAVYGNSNQSSINENHKTSPVSSYGIAKLTAEKYLSLLTENSATNFNIFRIGNAYGTHLLNNQAPTGLIPVLIKNILTAKTTDIWGSGNIIRDFIHVTDISDAFVIATTNDIDNGIYNLGTNQGTTIKSLITMIQNQLNKKAIINWLPSRTCDTKRVVLNSAKFNAVSGWQPKVNLNEGLKQIINLLDIYNG